MRDKQTAEVVKRLEGLLYVPIADQAELAAAHENEGRSETQTDKQTSEVVARLERLLRVQSPTKTSQRLAKLAAVDENENKGETYVLMRGLVVVLTYAGHASKMNTSTRPRPWNPDPVPPPTS